MSPHLPRASCQDRHISSRCFIFRAKPVMNTGHRRRQHAHRRQQGDSTAFRCRPGDRRRHADRPRGRAPPGDGQRWTCKSIKWLTSCCSLRFWLYDTRYVCKGFVFSARFSLYVSSLLRTRVCKHTTEKTECRTPLATIERHVFHNQPVVQSVTCGLLHASIKLVLSLTHLRSLCLTHSGYPD